MNAHTRRHRKQQDRKEREQGKHGKPVDMGAWAALINDQSAIPGSERYFEHRYQWLTEALEGVSLTQDQRKFAFRAWMNPRPDSSNTYFMFEQLVDKLNRTFGSSLQTNKYGTAIVMPEEGPPLPGR
jgi:hypothetical protein